MDVKDWIDSLSDKQKKHLEGVFSDYDSDKSGTIETKELKELFTESGYSFTKTQFNHVLKFADVDGSGTLDKKEFLAICSFLNAVQDLFDEYKVSDEEPAYVPFSKLRKLLAAAAYEFTNKQLRLCRALCDADKSGKLEFEEILDLFIYLKWLQVAFERVDKDNSNSISLEEVLAALTTLGHNIEPSKAKKVFAKVDIDRSNELCFSEFFEFTVEAKIDVRNMDYEDDGANVEFDS